MKALELYEAGFRIHYIIISCRNKFSVKAKSKGILYNLIQLRVIVEKHDYFNNITNEINKWEIIFQKYVMNRKIYPTHAKELALIAERWDEQIRAYVKSIKNVKIQSGGILNNERLLKGAISFFPPKIWKEISKICKDDLNDSIKCLLVGLATPAVMICLRGTEDVIRKYYISITSKPVERKTWGQLINELLSTKYKDKVNRTLIGHLDYIRESKRNVADHPDKRFTIDEAHIIFSTVIQTINEIYQELE